MTYLRGRCVTPSLKVTSRCRKWGAVAGAMIQFARPAAFLSLERRLDGRLMSTMCLYAGVPARWSDHGGMRNCMRFAIVRREPGGRFDCSVVVDGDGHCRMPIVPIVPSCGDAYDAAGSRGLRTAGRAAPAHAARAAAHGGPSPGMRSPGMHVGRTGAMLIAGPARAAP